MTGTATNPLMTALQNSALIGSIRTGNTHRGLKPQAKAGRVQQWLGVSALKASSKMESLMNSDNPMAAFQENSETLPP